MNREFIDANQAHIDATAESEIRDASVAAELAAEHIRAEFKYICDIIDSNEELLTAMFLSEEEKALDEPTKAKVLFNKVSEFIDDLHYICVNGARPGAHLGHFPMEQPIEKRGTKTGWYEWGPPMRDNPYVAKPGKQYAHLLQVSEEGQRIVEGLRAARGQAPLDELPRYRNRWECYQETGRLEEDVPPISKSS